MATLAEFEPQSQETPLSTEALSKLVDLKVLAGSGSSKLDERLNRAISLLRTSAGEINDRAYQERTQHLRKVNRLRKNGETEPAEEAKAFDKFQDQAKSLTKKLDDGTRKMIDQQVWLEIAPGAIDYAVERHAAASERLAQTQQSDVDHDPSVEDQDHPATRQNLDSSESASLLMKNELLEKVNSWTSKSLTERYTKNNDYKDFYRTVFDANNQDGNPPMPPESQWFAAEHGKEANAGGRSTQREQPSTQHDNDIEMAEGTDDGLSSGSVSDVEIHAERTRLTCPITLKYFEEPLKSTKCPHAFEKKYILEWLHKSTELAPLTEEQGLELSQINHVQERARRERQMRPRIVRCPECDIPLEEKDLRPDPVLVRMVRRELDREKREAEQEANEDEESDEDDLPRPSQRRKIVNIGSSPDRSACSRASSRRVKGERQIVVPQTQFD